MEHTPTTFETAALSCSLIAAGGSVPLIRVPVNSTENIKRALDVGAWGVIVPMVNSRTEAEQVVRAAMPNAGVRQRLQMADGEPSLVVLRRTWAHGRPVTFARLHHPGSRYEMTGHYTPPGTPKSITSELAELEQLQL